MKILKLALLLLLVSAVNNSFSQCGPLATAYNQNNGQDGIMFDIVGITSVEITNFDINCGGGTHDFEIYYKAGTHVGFEGNAGAWTLLGTANGVTGPINVATPIPLTFSVLLCPGDVAAFYVTSTGTGSIDYTNGTGVGNVLAADANIQILEGTGKDYPFANSFAPRSPNITVHYNCLANCAITCDASWTTTTACSTDPPVNLDPLITGDPGGTWSGTGVTGSTFDPSVGTQSITYSSPNGCDSIQTITVTTAGDATWTVPTGLCLTAAPIDLNTYITGTTGGTWSGTGVTGSMFDPSVGTQTITYSVGTAPCDDVLAQSITVTASNDASWTPPTGVCAGDAPIDLNTLITGDPGGTWSGTGVTGNTFDPSVGTQTITYTVGVAPCDATSAQSITVSNILDASWTPPASTCESDSPIDLNTLITGDTGGTWSGTGVTGNNFDPSNGTQNITYTVGTGGCQAILAQDIVVDPLPDPSWTAPTLCSSSAPMNLNSQITGDAGGTWSGTGMTGSIFDPFFGTQSITYSVTVLSCTSTSTQSITVVDPQLDLTATTVSCFGLSDGTTTVNVTGGSGNYTYSWNTSPPQSTSTANGVPSGMYTVTVTDTDGGCTATDSIEVIEPTEIALSMSGMNSCAPDLGSATVNASGGAGGFTYAWNNSTQTSATATGLDSAMHTVTVTDANGCTNSDSVLIQVFDAPAIETMPDTTIVYGECINLWADGGVTYEWTPDVYLDCDNCLSPESCPLTATNYCVEGTDVNGCKNTDCVLIDVEIVCGDIFVPSGFSPNNDGENDLLCVYSDCMETMSFSIYNRWGEQVYQTNSMDICWDGTWNGKILNSAVFVYVLDGYLINGQPINQKGNISLIR